MTTRRKMTDTILEIAVRVIEADQGVLTEEEIDVIQEMNLMIMNVEAAVVTEVKVETDMIEAEAEIDIEKEAEAEALIIEEEIVTVLDQETVVDVVTTDKQHTKK